MEKKIKTVEDYLNAVNYDYSDGYIPSDFALEFINFIKLVNGGKGEENKTPILHYIMLDKLANSRRDLINLLFRGAAKLESASTKLVTPTGLVKMEDIQAGDYIITRKGTKAKVVLKTPPQYPDMYKMYLEDGTVLEVGDEHNNIVVNRKGEESIKTTLELVNSATNYWIPLVDKPVEMEGVKVEVRKGIFRGIMDEYGFVKDDITYLCSNNINIVNKAINLLNGLGGMVIPLKTRRVYGKTVYNYEVISKFNPFDKYNLYSKRWVYRKKLGKRIAKIEKFICNEPGYCIAVNDDSASYLTRNYTVTHNTTLMGEYLFLYLGLYGKFPKLGNVNYAMYLTDSIDNGVKKMRKNMEYRWENSDFLQEWIPKINFTDTRWEFINKVKNRFVVNGYGVETGVRGTKEFGTRPQLCIIDDIISDKAARSDTSIKAIKDVVDKAIEYGLHPQRRRIIWNGTPFNKKDPIYSAIETGAWEVNVFPVCEQFPCKRSEFRGAWENRFDYDFVKNSYDKHKNNIAAFNQELMLRIISEEDRVVNESDIIWYNRANFLENRHKYNYYITTDFATSERQASDYSVISVWAYSRNKDWLWVDGIVKRQYMDKNIQDLFRFVNKYKPMEVGVEVSGQQGGFIQWIYEKMTELNTYFTLASDNNSNKPGLRPSTNKLQRFMVALPIIKAHKLWFPKELKNDDRIVEFLAELSLITSDGIKSKKDDCIDTISQLPLLNAFTPSEESKVKLSGTDAIFEDEYYEEFASNNLVSYTVD